MHKRVSENRIVDVLIAHLRKSHHVAREVRHYEKRIDIVVVDDHSRVLAIEAKVENWQRAMMQAHVNLAAAEFSYVAMYAPNAHRVPLERLRAEGIGLIAVGTKWGDVSTVLTASASPYVNRLAEDLLRKRVRTPLPTENAEAAK